MGRVGVAVRTAEGSSSLQREDLACPERRDGPLECTAAAAGVALRRRHELRALRTGAKRIRRPIDVGHAFSVFDFLLGKARGVGTDRRRAPSRTGNESERDGAAEEEHAPRGERVDVGHRFAAYSAGFLISGAAPCDRKRPQRRREERKPQGKNSTCHHSSRKRS